MQISNIYLCVFIAFGAQGKKSFNCIFIILENLLSLIQLYSNHTV